MKKAKKLTAFLLLAAFVFAFIVPVTAMADTTGSITINNTVKDKSYDLYKIFDLTYKTVITGTGDDEKTTVQAAYTIDSDWTAFFNSDGGREYIVDSNENEDGESLGLNSITVGNDIKYINITKENIAEFAKAALSYAVTKDADKEVTGTGEAVTADDLTLGYYLVYPRGAGDSTEENGSICSLTSTTPNATVNIKADYPTIEKKVNDNNPEIGQTITYTITGKVPDTTGYESYTYTVEDTMSNGLTFNKNVTVVIDVDGNGVLENDEDNVSVTVAPDYTTMTNGFIVNIGVKDYQHMLAKIL